MRALMAYKPPASSPVSPTIVDLTVEEAAPDSSDDDDDVSLPSSPEPAKAGGGKKLDE